MSAAGDIPAPAHTTAPRSLAVVSWLRKKGSLTKRVVASGRHNEIVLSRCDIRSAYQAFSNPWDQAYGSLASFVIRDAKRRVGARLSIRFRVLGWHGYGPTRERLSVCLCISTLGVNVRICRVPRVYQLGW